MHWRAEACTGVLWRALACAGVHWRALACTGVHWRALVSSGVHWRALAVVDLTTRGRPVKADPSDAEPEYTQSSTHT
jgi:hypothetical protein